MPGGEQVGAVRETGRREAGGVTLPLTQKMLLDWGGPVTFRDGKNMFERGAVHVAHLEWPVLRGTILLGQHAMATSARLYPDGSCENLCPCRDNTERGVVCPHIIALGLAVLRRAADPDLRRRQEEEARRAKRLSLLRDEVFLTRARPGDPAAVPARLSVALEAGWQETLRRSVVPLQCGVECQGRWRALDDIPRGLALALSPADDNLLAVLEDIAGGAVTGRLEMAPRDFFNVLELCRGRRLHEVGRAESLVVNVASMSSVLRVDLDRENGELLLMVHTELPFQKAGEWPVYLVADRAGWVYATGQFWPLAQLLPEPLRSLYDQPVTIPRPAVPHFLREELPRLSGFLPVETELDADLFVMEPAEPVFRLVVRGSPASLAATLWADYHATSLIAGKPDARGGFAEPDPEDLLRYLVRNEAREAEALRRLAAAGLAGETGDQLASIVGSREVLNFLGSRIPELRRRGWRVELEGRVQPFMEAASFVIPVVRVREGEGGDWFEVNFEYEDGAGGGLPAAAIQRALLKNEAFLELDGRTWLLDAAAIQGMKNIFADCATADGSAPGSFRMTGVFAPYVKACLEALDGVDIEAPAGWQQRADRGNRRLCVEPVPLNEPLVSILRPYQKEGVHWLRFLEHAGLGGILADEMGLGKTLQTLAWISLRRVNAAVQQQPVLIVCPTSLVENWSEEIARFVPHLKVLAITGSDRHAKWGEVAAANVVITSYALLRRDSEQYRDLAFAAVVLDEAQHIKNRSTQNALAAKRLQAPHRLVLTGTPVENSVSDLWSIMDFLMPGYLGSHETFHQHYEVPLSQGAAEAETAQARLRRKIHPFLLRRMKREVARDLPPKIQRLAHCTLTPDQRQVYVRLVEQSRRRLGELVEKQGLARSRMEILKTLLRLRQVCCHLDLLKLPDLQSANPSAKMDLFFELLDEAFDAGHRVLVFSQFVSMLSILRRELEQRDLAYCYLDGATKERLKVVHEFNTHADIPLFLISLKAGGTGLNLTGADMVVHYDPWWNPAVEDQATDRAYRIGQKRTVYSIKLITRDTVEEKVLALQRRKQAVIDATLVSDERLLERLTWDDIQELLTL